MEMQQFSSVLQLQRSPQSSREWLMTLGDFCGKTADFAAKRPGLCIVVRCWGAEPAEIGKADAKNVVLRTHCNPKSRIPRMLSIVITIPQKRGQMVNLCSNICSEMAGDNTTGNGSAGQQKRERWCALPLKNQTLCLHHVLHELRQRLA